ncbi:hypothetical protein [Saccharibacter floricola]|uniref:hypothetical protein n=1 Tax=Saccharibacter floricola TaxID=231053 RepID=UPI00037FF419|nr:hypothetical protein [Saccharibacter floricola]
MRHGEGSYGENEQANLTSGRHHIADEWVCSVEQGTAIAQGTMNAGRGYFLRLMWRGCAVI